MWTVSITTSKVRAGLLYYLFLFSNLDAVFGFLCFLPVLRSLRWFARCLIRLRASACVWYHSCVALHS